MNLWPRPPMPGSLEEEMFLAVEFFEEHRKFEYLSAVVYGMAHAQQGKEGLDGITEMMNELYSAFFSGGAKKVEEGEQEEFLDLMEKHVVRIKQEHLRRMALQEQRVISDKQVYVPEPQGELLE